MVDATLTDLCGMLDVEWRQNWKEIGTGHGLGDVEVDEQVVVRNEPATSRVGPASHHRHLSF